jgi:hypothetical protein
MKNIFSIIFLFFFCASAFAQDDLLSDLATTPTREKVSNAFKSSRVINNQSMEMLAKGALDFRILHRFGDISQGGYDFFGLDQASMRMGFDYGITTNLMVGVGRSTNKKEMDGFLKYRILWQESGTDAKIPVSVVWISGITRNGLRDPFGPELSNPSGTQRLGYYHQLVIGRKFNNKFTAQIMPTYIHQNVVPNTLTPNDLYALGFGGRYKVTKRVAVVCDYQYAFNRFPGRLSYNPLSFGVDIETGGHVFQLHVSNAVGMNERAYISDNNGSFLDRGARFGFNLSRVFQLR